MKLEYLKLTNFRGFREFEITFDPSFTVLLGGNMAGKSAVLDGAAVALGISLRDTGRSRDDIGRSRDILDDEIRQIVEDVNGIADLQRQFPVIVEASATYEGFPHGPSTWKRLRDGIVAPTVSTGTFFDLSNSAITISLPVIAQYGTRRVWGGSGTNDDIRGVASRFDGYIGCFDITSTHTFLATWMKRQTLVQLQRGSAYAHPQLMAVESAIKTCLDEITSFWYDVQYDELRLKRTGGDIQSFGMLSEGYRNTVAMVADIAWRTSVINPHLGAEAHLRTAGVVLIDELDLHLHPAWQRRIVADLRRTFPKIQFIVTTHSPQIVASVKRDQVRLLDRNQLVAEEPYVQGRSSDEILEDVFGVTARPEAVRAEIDALYRSIEDEDFPAARQQLAALQERLGPDDAAMIRARWILDSEEAQASRGSAAAP